MSKLRRPRLGKSILVIPDAQVKPGVDTSHMDWIGQYALDKQFDSWVCLGDWADLPSLSSYSLGQAEAEGARYVDDIAASKSAMSRLLAPMRKYNRGRKNKYEPPRHMCLGNHEDRADREGRENPRLLGKVSSSDLGYREDGWIVHPFLKVIVHEGVEFSHYYCSGPKGLACSSAAAILRTRQRSAVAGHLQHFDVCVHPKTQATAIIAGTCNLHDEQYLGWQGNNYKRQVIVLNECDGTGRFDLMAVSLAFLKSRYS